MADTVPDAVAGAVAGPVADDLATNVGDAAGMLDIVVCYAKAGEEFLQPLRVAPGTTIGQAIEGSGVLAAYPEINLVTQPVGIYAKKKTLDTVLRHRDRIEIYRPLVADPKDSRRKRAAKKETAQRPAA